MSAESIVHLPTAAEVEQAKVSSRTLSKYTDVDRVKLSLRGSNGESDELVLPGGSVAKLKVEWYDHWPFSRLSTPESK